MDTKTIIIDAFQYSADITGTDRMSYNYLKYLQKIDNKNRYTVICSNDKFIPSVINSINFSCVSPKHSLNNKLLYRLYCSVWRRMILLRLKRANADTFLSFHNMRTPFIKIAKKTVMFNLDLIPLVLDGYKSSSLLRTGKVQKYYERSVQKSDEIVCISKFSEKELIEYFPKSKGKTHVIHLASDERFKFIEKTKKENNILTVGGSETRKNVNQVIAAYSSLPGQLKEKYKLVIVGGDWRNKKLNYNYDNIQALGYVSDNKLYSLYKKSSLFVFASSYEGFGFSILEAMSSGAPVLTSDSTSLPEVGGDAVCYFETNNISSLAKKMETILISEEKRNNMINKGLEQASKFSWVKSASELKSLLIS